MAEPNHGRPRHLYQYNPGSTSSLQDEDSQGPVAGGAYGQEPVGGGAYGQGPVGGGAYGQGPVGGGAYGQGPVGAGAYGPGPVGAGAYGPGPVGAGAYGPGPVGAGAYGPGPVGAGAYGPGPVGAGAYGPGPVGAGAYGQRPVGAGAYGQGPVGAGAYGQGPVGAGAYGQGPVGAGAYGQGPVGAGAYGQGPVGAGAYGQGPVGAGAYGQGPVGAGAYGQGPVGAGAYGQGPVGAGAYGQGPVGAGAYGQGPVGAGAYGQGPVGAGAYGQGPVGAGAYGQGPVGAGAYGQGPVGAGAYGQGPVGAGAYGQGPVGAGAYGQGPVGGGYGQEFVRGGYGQEFVGGGYGQEFVGGGYGQGPVGGGYGQGPVGGGYGQEFVGAYPQGHIEYTARQSNPVGTYSSKQLDSATSLQLHSAYGHHSVTSESDSYAAAVTPQQVSSLYQTFENCDYSLSTEPPSQSLPGELAKLRIHGPQETFQRRPPQRADERWHSKRTGTYTTHSPMQRAVGGHQVQAQQIGYETSVQSQPVTSGLYGYGAESSSDHGKAPRRPYSGSSKNRWPPTTPSGFYTKSQSSSDESYQQGFSRGSWNSNNERKVSESHRPGTSQVSSPSQSSPSMDGATSTSGTVASTKVRANHFQLKMQTNIVLYRYSVEIRQIDEKGKTLPEGEKVGTSAKLRAFAVFANALDDQRPIYDGQESFYSIKDLQQGRTENVSLGGEKDKRHYSVRIHDRKKLQHSGHWTSLAADFVQALDVAIRCALSNDRMRIGRLLFGKEDDEKLVKRFGETGLEPYRGILTSARQGQSEMFLNVDTILTGFYKTCRLTDLLQGLCNTAQTIAWPLNEVGVKFLKSLIGFKIEVRHQGYTRVRKIESITPETAEQLKLGEPKDSTTGSIAEYFDKYGGLQYPDLPCVKVVSSRTCYYPLEKCFLKLGQKGTSKLPCELARPKERFEFAINIVNELIEKHEQYFSTFVKEIVPEPVETEYKILPILQTSRTTVLAGEVKWKIVNTCETNAYIEDFINGIREVGGEMGVAMSDPMLQGRRPPGIEPNQNDHSGFHIVVFVLNRKNSVHYPRIKYLAEIKYGLITQCVVQSIKMKGRNFQMNVMRKIKAKLGVVDKAMPVDKLSFEDVLVMGADVSHHSPNESKPSVAAIVASIDDCASRYVAAIRPQQKFNDKKRVETIMEMTSMAKELFGYYAEKLRKNPKHILFYRDGVSEGEFRNVCGTELENLKRACRNAFGVEPKITFVTVQKRHRTRFTLNDGNVPPGTVVNTTITQEPEREFFLCSHTPIRGTARPAHYRVYVDECDLPPERLQEITFSLCHMYARCDTPVSIPAPVYYAHLAAARASCHMKGNPQDTTDPINIAESVKKKMFFV